MRVLLSSVLRQRLLVKLTVKLSKTATDKLQLATLHNKLDTHHQFMYTDIMQEHGKDVWPLLRDNVDKLVQETSNKSIIL